MGMDVDFADVIRRHRAGERTASDWLARRTLTIALRTAAAVTGSREQAADIAQDVAVEALRGVRRLNDPERFDAWVHRITVRMTMRAIRSSRRRGSVEEALVDDVEPAAEPSGPEQFAERAAMRLALADLPQRQRIALALRYVHDLSEEEVAEALGCRPGTAASLLSRGRELLRQSAALSDFAPARARGGTR
jgi:RNA polymerase sigma-70 factor (ECF subfamily)